MFVSDTQGAVVANCKNEFFLHEYLMKTNLNDDFYLFIIIVIFAGPADFQINTEPMTCVGDSTPVPVVIADNCDTAPTFTCVPSGSSLPLGATALTCAPDPDSSGNAAQNDCAVTVTVVDGEAPVVTCPSPITRSTDGGVCTSSLVVPATTATDNCDTSPTVTCSVASGAQTMPLGTTTVACNATDVALNPSEWCRSFLFFSSNPIRRRMFL